MRYLIKFSKESQIKFVSHLDLMRTIQRVIRRAALPIEYSRGFNPHMAISLAQPLAVGMYSTGDYMDIVLTEEVATSYIKEVFNKNAPEGVKLIEAIKVKDLVNQKKIPQAMALIDAAKYVISLRYNDTSILSSELKNLIDEKEWGMIKKSKSGEKFINLRDYIKALIYEISDKKLIITTTIACGSRENLSAELLAEYILKNTTSADLEAFKDIRREEMYIKNNDEIISLYDYIRAASK
ncbi:TIGR03936 family radical SAM-associated protein [Candidatus Clostridium stratigraminis]|uniref:TIGR03936 family radical SAM-associated protein n=1 Tax=Candidatus Clostridium stratigraminis TaxID=3381661 RepID=A0ABW8T4T8_9CLOT